jgi:hypothetical protein
MRATAYRVAGGIMTLLFVLAAALQYNDPDPHVWIPLYGAAAAVAGWSTLRRAPWWTPATVLAVAGVWCALLIPRVVGHTSLRDMFGTIGMKDVHAEEGRELGGLAIVALWMLVVLIVELRARRRARRG